MKYTILLAASLAMMNVTYAQAAGSRSLGGMGDQEQTPAQAQKMMCDAFPQDCRPRVPVPINDNQFIYVDAIYQLNGEMVTAADGMSFQSAKECGDYADNILKRGYKQSKASGNSPRIYGDSVATDNDGIHGYAWAGCIPQKYADSEAFARYVDIHMTPEKAKTMSRFPDLSKLQ